MQQGKEIKSVNVEIKQQKLYSLLYSDIYIYTHKYKINFEEII